MSNPIDRNKNKDREKAKLILLIGAYMSARREDDTAAEDSAADALQEFSENTRYAKLATKADSILALSNIEDMEEGLRQMTGIAEKLSPLRQTFQAGADIAEKGRASLFFPRAASTLVQVDELLSSLLSTAEDFKDDISSAMVDFDIEKMLALVGKVKETGEKLDKQLNEMSKKPST
jgi:hypothetical protein